MPILLVFLLAVISCKEEHEQSDPSYVALEHNSAWYIKAGLLIKKVHDKSWTIAFGFSDNARCGSEFTDNHLSQLKDQLTKVLKLWLKPLYDIQDKPKNDLTIDEPLVAKFDYEERTVVDVKYEATTRKELTGEKDYVMGLIVRCEAGRSYALSDFSGGPTLVHLLKVSSEMQRNAITDLKRYRLTTLLHELGHAFGLADTYIDKSPGTMASRFSIASAGGDSYAIGNQPLSVMNYHSLVALNHLDEIDITDDDRNGIEWLYRRYIKESVGENECPDDYQYEASTNGCKAKYLFIHTARQGNIEAIDRLLRDDMEIDVNQQDSLGNTALHYAAIKEYRELHGDKLYLYLQSVCNRNGVCVDPTIVNNAEKTAEQLFGDNDDLAAFRQAITMALNDRNTLFAGGLIKAALIEEYGNVVDNKDIQDAVNSSDAKLATMLHHASRKKWIEVAKVLLGISSIDVNRGDIDNYRPLHNAASWGSTEIVTMLLKHKKIIATATTVDGDTPLHRAARRGNQVIVEKLLPLSTGINATNNDDKTPLHFAAAYNWDGRQAVSLLLDQTGITVNAKTIDGHTPLHLAAKAGRSPIVVGLLLADERVDQTLTDNEGKSALELANDKKIELDEKVAELNEKIKELKGATSEKDKNIHKEYLALVEDEKIALDRYVKIIEKLCGSPTFRDDRLCKP